MIDVERALFTQTNSVPAVNREPRRRTTLIDALNRAGDDISQLDALLLEHGHRRADRRLGPLELVLRHLRRRWAARSTRSAPPGAAAPGRAPARTPAPRPRSTRERAEEAADDADASLDAPIPRRGDARDVPAGRPEAGPVIRTPQPRQLGPQAAPLEDSSKPRGGRRKPPAPSAIVAPSWPTRPTCVIEHPNRRKASSQLARLVVIVLLIASAALVLIVSIGGWDTLEGAKPIQIAFIVDLRRVGAVRRALEPRRAADDRGAGDHPRHLRRGRRARLVRPRQGRLHRPGDLLRRARAALRAARARCRSR